MEIFLGICIGFVLGLLVAVVYFMSGVFKEAKQLSDRIKEEQKVFFKEFEERRKEIRKRGDKIRADVDKFL